MQCREARKDKLKERYQKAAVGFLSRGVLVRALGSNTVEHLTLR